MTFFTRLASKSLNRTLACFMLTFVMLAFYSCKKNEVPAVVQSSYLTVVNASPTLSTFNFYLDQSRVNSAALPFGGVIPYFTLNPGKYNAKFTTASNTESIITKEITIDPEKIYSLFLIDKDDKMDYLLINDPMDVVTEKAFIRFINLSPDAPALNLAIKDSITVISDKSYKTNSEFLEIEPKSYDFQIKDKITGAILAELKNSTINTGKYYTIIARGLQHPADTEQIFSAQLIINK